MKLIRLFLISFMSASLFSCANKNCEDNLNTYVLFDAGGSVPDLKLSYGLSQGTSISYNTTDTRALVNTRKAIYTVEFNASCQAPKEVDEYTNNVFICASQMFYGVCKDNSSLKVKFISAPFSCPSGYTFENKYNSGC